MAIGTRSDVCVIGSGAGGATIATELALAGATVTLLEAGSTAPRPAIGKSEISGLAHAVRGGAYVVSRGGWLLPKFVIHGRCEGGSTAINTGNCFRLPHHIHQEWQQAGVPDLSDYYRRVDTFLQVTETDATLLGTNGHKFLEGIRALNWAGGPMPRNAPGCTGRSICVLGCPEEAKRGTHISYLPVARKNGANVLLNTRAIRIRLKGRRATGLEAVTSNGDLRTFSADRIVLAGGSLFTPALLQQSGINTDGIGKNLCIHPAFLLIPHFPSPVEMGPPSVPQSAYSSEFIESEGFFLLNQSVPQMLIAPLLALLGQTGALPHYARAGLWAALVHDDGANSVLSDGSDGYRISCRLTETTRRSARKALLRLAEAAFMAGAHSVTPVLLGTRTIRTYRELDRWLPDPLPENRLITAGFHPMGTCAIGRVCDGTGLVRGYESLYVADASLFPSASGVTPQMSVMALATSVAAEMLTN